MIQRTGVIHPAILVMFTILVVGIVNAGCSSSTPNESFQKETAPVSTTQAATSTTLKSAVGIVEGYEIYENKDPFQPLYGPGANTRTLTKTTVTTDTTAGGTTSTTTTTDQTQVRLVSINGAAVTINAGGTDYPDLKAGDSFGGSYKLLTIGTGSVTILYGDNQYTLYLGETISVK